MEVVMTTRNFAMIIGIAYLAAGVFGFIPPLLFAPPGDAPGVGITAFYGYLLGLFPVNLMHNLVHLAIGAWGIAAARSMAGARTFSKVLAIFYGVLAVMGMIPGLQTLFGLAPIHGHDVWLHALTAIAAAYFGWMHRATAADTVKAAMR
jgi:hypothetical protein